MNPQAIKQLVILVLCGIAAVIFGSILASGNYESLLLLAYAAVAIYVIAVPGFVPLIAIGILNPFILPIPFIYGLPFIMPILAICCLKLFFRNALGREQNDSYRHCFIWGFVAVFGWVVVRYLMNPVMPNFSGFGANVSGFRSYLSYGICFMLVVLLPLFLSTRDQVVSLCRWMGGISFFFILLFVPLIFTKSLLVAMWLNRFGIFIVTFDNGWMRFVVLPGFGLMLLTLALFPNLVPLSRSGRIIMGLLGLIAVVLGGNRGSFLMAFAMVLLVPLLRRRLKIFILLVAGSSIVLLAVHFIGEELDIRGGVGFLRVMSLTSRRMADESGASSTVEWRMVRWRRAMEEIRANPLFGKGYGGLENAWLYTDSAQFEDARVEVDLASGGVHNGYLAGAYSLGIPAVLFFLISLIGQLIKNFKLTRRFSEADPVMSDLHGFVFVNLVGLIIAIYVGTDLNAPMIWLFLALGVLLSRLKATKPVVTEVTQPSRIQRPLFAGPSAHYR